MWIKNICIGLSLSFGFFYISMAGTIPVKFYDESGSNWQVSACAPTGDKIIWQSTAKSGDIQVDIDSQGRLGTLYFKNRSGQRFSLDMGGCFLWGLNRVKSLSSYLNTSYIEIYLLKENQAQLFITGKEGTPNEKDGSMIHSLPETMTLELIQSQKQCKSVSQTSQHAYQKQSNHPSQSRRRRLVRKNSGTISYSLDPLSLSSHGKTSQQAKVEALKVLAQSKVPQSKTKPLEEKHLEADLYASLGDLSFIEFVEKQRPVTGG